MGASCLQGTEHRIKLRMQSNLVGLRFPIYQVGETKLHLKGLKNHVDMLPSHKVIQDSGGKFKFS